MARTLSHDAAKTVIPDPTLSSSRRHRFPQTLPTAACPGRWGEQRGALCLHRHQQCTALWGSKWMPLPAALDSEDTGLIHFKAMSYVGHAEQNVLCSCIHSPGPPLPQAPEHWLASPRVLLQCSTHRTPQICLDLLVISPRAAPDSATRGHRLGAPVLQHHGRSYAPSSPSLGGQAKLLHFTE